MIIFDWDAIYLTCFGVGLVLSVLAFASGLGHLHLGHFHFHFGHHHGGPAHKAVVQSGAHHAGQISPVNGFTVVAFLCWFGGTGYLLHHGNVFSNSLVLLFSCISGLAGASLIFWFLSGVLMAREKTLEPADTDMTGVVGRLSGGIPANGVGEILYSQNGSRRAAPVRSDDGSPIERGAEVIVMRHKRGLAYVRRWDAFEHGLLGSETADKAEP
ncbi:MAG TPA: hypothetical protein VLI45_00955 [Acidobacteriaceae bacterium]|nr:hypothetical protein [Acidobacteriaceae bacterium]